MAKEKAVDSARCLGFALVPKGTRVGIRGRYVVFAITDNDDSLHRKTDKKNKQGGEK